MPTADHQNPDEYRMTLGEHLEDLRRRLIYSILGFVAVLGLALWFGKSVISRFCEPYITTLIDKGQNPQFYFGLSEGFAVYIQISLIVAAAISAPWALYQFWLFVAAGLYPRERTWVKRYAPLSIALLIGGMLFVYYLVLPWTIDFFIDFGSDIPMTVDRPRAVVPVTQPSPAPAQTPHFDGDPQPWPPYSFWFNRVEGRLKFIVLQPDGTEQVRVVPFGPQNLAAPLMTLADYIDLVMGMLLTFGLSFQMPLVVLALVRIGILRLEAVRGARKYVYFAMVILAAVITPGDAWTSTIALSIPLCLLYELGIWLAKAAQRRVAAE